MLVAGRFGTGVRGRCFRPAPEKKFSFLSGVPHGENIGGRLFNGSTGTSGFLTAADELTQQRERSRCRQRRNLW